MNGGCILLINQDADTVQICTDLFSTRGLEVMAVQGGEEALHAARSAAPRVIVTELRTVTDDGWEIIELLKGTPETAAIPLVALTACALPDHRHRARDADVFLAKPADLQTVLAAVERLVG